MSGIHAYLVVITIGNTDKNAEQRVAEIAPMLHAVLTKLSDNKGQIAFTGYKGTSFGYILQSNKEAHTIRSIIINSTQLSELPDSCLVFGWNGAFGGSNKINLWLDQNW